MLVCRESKTVTLYEWLEFFEYCLAGRVEGISVDAQRVAATVDFLINEGSLSITLEEMSL